ncbi:hypothetical protein NC652_009952 [Populus alba x Populus x berolinensis]|uniref:Uncharacterized protein n=1 Tax=Populus alba x Populus x berolinensis TaxID=444605 RepID=A0AAD6RBR6_9ROSI|nr:hypothetical protein NC652_009952 [Populus alba x Populus x berolinensis]KAJ7005337.1 hypothetical protein NC653_009976 [Populus alba x Populus x berolinensis]
MQSLRRLSKMDFSFNPLNIVDTRCGDDTNTSNLLGRKFDEEQTSSTGP